MSDKFFLYRRGNGNEGNYQRAIVQLRPTESPYAALRALVVNDYIAGKRARRHIIRTIEIDGEADYGVQATVYEGPSGETKFGAAYITAALEPIDNPDEYSVQCSTLRDSLDRGAMRIFKKHNRGFA